MSQTERQDDRRTEWLQRAADLYDRAKAEGYFGQVTLNGDFQAGRLMGGSEDMHKGWKVKA